MVKRHGEGYDWQHAPLDPVTMHASGGGKTHGLKFCYYVQLKFTYFKF
jgi:hypothetical protein